MVTVRINRQGEDFFIDQNVAPPGSRIELISAVNTIECSVRSRKLRLDLGANVCPDFTTLLGAMTTRLPAILL